MPKKQVLFVYESFNIGGSTTSLINLLRGFDYARFDIDLISYRSGNEEIRKKLPKHINILKDAAKYGENRSSKVIKAARSAFSSEFWRALKARRQRASKYVFLQHMSYARLKLSRRVKKHYDAVIGYVEGWSNSYALSKLVDADKRIIFIHIDYLASGSLPQIDRKAFSRADSIVSVSQSCLRGFQAAFPEYSNRAVCIENIFDVRELIQRSAAEPNIDIGEFDIITVCRPDIYVKGLDRILNVAAKLRENGYRFRWGLLGVSDRGEFHKLYSRYDLIDTVIPLGSTNEPYPYFKRARILAVTSRHEAKPTVVTEAQILGLPCIVTDYCSAREQVRDGVDGLIVENSENGIFSVICRVLDDSDLINSFSDELKNKHFGFENSYKTLYDLIER